MKIRTLTIASLAVLSFTACDNEMTTPENEFKVNSTICQSEPVTRTPQLDQDGAGTFSTGDKNTFLFMTDASQVIKDFEYTYGQTYRWSDIDLPSDVKTAKVSAWYPARTVGSSTHLSWNVQNESNPDFLMAAPVSIKARQAEPIRLNFKHMMHRLQVKIVSADPAITSDDLSKAQIICRNFYPIVDLNVANATSGNVSGNYHTLSRTDSKADFIIPAQAAGSVEVEVTMKDKKKVFKIAEMSISGQPVTRLESGKTLILTITATQTELTLSTTIGGWEDQGDLNDTIII